ncbi:MAG: hypothetical protein R2755_20500 [Acidimicrobiales bacterium]
MTRSFSGGQFSVPLCRTCTSIAHRYPLARPVQPSTELARVRHLLHNTRRRIDRGDPVARDLLVERLYLLTG